MDCPAGRADCSCCHGSGGTGVFLYFYHRYDGLVSERLKQGPLFASVAQIYAAPQEVRPGQQRTAEEIAASLRTAGYNTNPEMGTYRLQGDTIQVKPGPQSYLAADGATIVTTDGQVKTITAEDGAALAGYKLEPQLITALSEGDSRTKAADGDVQRDSATHGTGDSCHRRSPLL